MSNQYDTARRERAEKWARKSADTPGQKYDMVDGYLAGAREEAAIKDEEIAKLREEIVNHAAWAKEFSLDPANGAIVAAQAEIAALREAVKQRYTVDEVTAWLSEYHGKYRAVPMTEWIRNRRAREEKP